MESDYSSSNEENITGSKRRRVSNRFTAAQAASLQAYYANGMVGTGKKFDVFICRAANDTMLTVEQVKRWIKKKNFRVRNVRPSLEANSLFHKKKKRSAWWEFLKKFGESEDGKEAMRNGPLDFNKAASSAYKDVSLSEREAMVAKASSTEVLTSKVIRKQGKQIFGRIKKLFLELEDLGYNGFSWAYYEDLVLFSSTQKAMCFSSPELTEFFHGTITACDRPVPPRSVCPKCSSSLFSASLSKPSAMVSMSSAIMSKPSTVTSMSSAISSTSSPITSMSSAISAMSSASSSMSSASSPMSSASSSMSSASSSMSSTSLSMSSVISSITYKPSAVTYRPSASSSMSSASSSMSSASSSMSSASSSMSSATMSKPSAISSMSSAITSMSCATMSKPSAITSMSSVILSATSSNTSAMMSMSSTIKSKPSAIMSMSSATLSKPSAISFRPSAMMSRPSVILSKPSAMMSRSSAMTSRSSAMTFMSSIMMPTSSAMASTSSAMASTSSAILSKPSVITSMSSTITFMSSAVSLMSSATSSMFSAISSMSSAISSRPSAILSKSSSFSSLSSVIICKPSAIASKPSAIASKPSAIMCISSAITSKPSALTSLSSVVSSKPSDISSLSSATKTYAKSKLTVPEPSSSLFHVDSCLEDGVVELSDSPMKQNLDFWLPKLNLFYSDKEVLLSDQWINDNIISAAQSLLRKQCSLHGWMSTHLSLFEPVPLDSPFVQILHINNSHWITVSNCSFGCGSASSFKDCVKIYDSANPSRVSLTLQRTICSIMKPQSSMLTFEIVNVQNQMNSYDCGVFAIAFATEIAFGHNPVLTHFDSKEMRKHLMKCFEQQHMFRFPCQRQRRVPLGSRVKFYVQQPIHCTCRTINDVALPMVLCSFCKGWFHYKCENIQENDVAGLKWMCSKCIKILNM